MEALSPRDANAHLRKQPPAKLKAPVAKAAGKEKDHPPPPPSDVIEPPSFDRKHGATYRTGDLLGRGGFAICYKARLAGTRDVYALKIVKSKMQQKKMEQKVKFTIPEFGISADSKKVSNRAPNPLQNEAPKYRSISPRLCLRTMYISRSRIVPKWISDGYGQEAQVYH